MCIALGLLVALYVFANVVLGRGRHDAGVVDGDAPKNNWQDLAKRRDAAGG